MVNLSTAVKKTLSYAGFFDYPLHPEEVHRWLISSQPITSDQLKPFLPPALSNIDVQKRQKLAQIAKAKILSSEKFVKYLSYFPTIRFIAVTGSLAVQNSQAGDDIDLFLITTPHSLWLTRIFVLLLSSYFGRRRHPSSTNRTSNNTFCLNLWLETNSLTVPTFKHNLYTAHEVLQILPLYDADNYYQQFLFQNSWVKKYLANAFISLTSPQPHRSCSVNLLTMFDYLFAPFNLLAFVLQYLYMYPKITHETISLSSAYFHPRTFHQQIQKHLRK